MSVEGLAFIYFWRERRREYYWKKLNLKFNYGCTIENDIKKHDRHKIAWHKIAWQTQNGWTSFPKNQPVFHSEKICMLNLMFSHIYIRTLLHTFTHFFHVFFNQVNMVSATRVPTSTEWSLNSCFRAETSSTRMAQEVTPSTELTHSRMRTSSLSTTHQVPRKLSRGAVV